MKRDYYAIIPAIMTIMKTFYSKWGKLMRWISFSTMIV